MWEMAEEYLEVVQKHPPCTLSYVRAHLFKLWHHTYVCPAVRPYCYNYSFGQLYKTGSVDHTNVTFFYFIY